jgi:hypothetical protein
MAIETTSDLSLVGTSQIVDGSVTSAKIGAGAVVAASIAAGAVGSAAIAAGAVGSSALASGAVGAAAISSGAATSGQILQANGSGGVSFATSESSKPYWLEISGIKAGTSLGIPSGPYAIENFGNATNVKISPSTATASFASGSAIRISATSQITEIGNEIGINWSNKSASSGITDSINLRAIAQDSSTYLAAAGSPPNIYYSTNPTSNFLQWTLVSTGLNTSLNTNGAAYGNGTWVIAGRASSPSNTAIIANSTDLTTWTSRTTQFGSEIIYGVYYGGDRFVAFGGGSPGVSTSPDGVTWTQRTGGFQGNLIFTGAYGNSTYFLGGESAKYSWSIDGSTFTSNAASIGIWSTTSANAGYLLAAAYGNNTWVVGGGIGQIATSPSTAKDSWTKRTTGFATSMNISALVFDGSKFIAFTTTGLIRTSPDGITWTARTSNATSEIKGCVYYDGTLVAVGNSGTIITSDNRTNIIAQPITYSSVT